MRHSESIGNLAAALVAAQGDIKAVEKSAVNPHFKSKYVPLDAIVAMARPALAKHGIAVVQGAPSEDGNALNVETMLVHSSGEWLANTVHIPIAKKDPQGAGAAVTYGRRFGLAALLSLTSDEDDDGHAASQPAKRQDRAPRSEPRGEARQRPVQPAASEAADVGKNVVPEDVQHEGRRLGDMTDGELAGLAMQMREKGKNGWLRAISAVRTNRQLGTGPKREPTADELVTKMKADIEAEHAALPF